MNKKVRIKRVDKSLPLPRYHTVGSAGFDLTARTTMVIRARALGYVPLNVVIEPPEGYYMALVARSSLHKRGLIPANGFGVGDRDFAGNDDEYTAVLYNFTDSDVAIERGDRIMQAVISPVLHVEFIEVDDMENKNRGGFGTTGVR
ncbi:MAG: dUTP diphosphatase [bacterium]|nr:dUTP diphosphatase [bacterium]